MYYIRVEDDGHGDARTERRLGVLPTTLLPTPIISSHINPHVGLVTLLDRHVMVLQNTELNSSRDMYSLLIAND